MGGGLNAIGQGESSENQGTAIERYCNRKVLQSKGTAIERLLRETRDAVAAREISGNYSSSRCRQSRIQCLGFLKLQQQQRRETVTCDRGSR
jgi:hypothetical protein